MVGAYSVGAVGVAYLCLAVSDDEGVFSSDTVKLYRDILRETLHSRDASVDAHLDYLPFTPKEKECGAESDRYRQQYNNEDNIVFKLTPTEKLGGSRVFIRVFHSKLIIARFLLEYQGKIHF